MGPERVSKGWDGECGFDVPGTGFCVKGRRSEMNGEKGWKSGFGLGS